MHVTINGESRTLPENSTVLDLILDMNLEGKIAVEINSEILPKSRFKEYQINNGDVLEIVHAIGGG